MDGGIQKVVHNLNSDEGIPHVEKFENNKWNTLRLQRWYWICDFLIRNSYKRKRSIYG